MMNLFIIFFFFKNFNLIYVMILFMFFFLIIKDYYLGLFFFNLNFMLMILLFMSLMILLIILLSEYMKNLIFLSFFLIIISILFFLSFNIFFIYLFFELSLFPVIIMILSFGYQIEKINSSYYLFFYTLLCSMPFFFFFFNLDLNFLMFYFMNFYSWELMILLSLLFLVKFPIYFLHLWLPKAHVEASTTASMLLAGLLLKLGSGGFMRFLKILNFNFINWYFYLSFLGMVLSNFLCLFQSDLKSLAAYSSINHMSLVLLILCLINNYSLWCSVIIMFSHGLISILMFFFIGEFYHNSLTRMNYFYQNFFLNLMNLSFIISLVWLYNSGIPFSITFFSEFGGFLILFNLNLFYFFLGFLYFFLTFYYCLYFITLNFMGKNFIFLNSFFGLFSCYLLIMNSNIFIFSLFF